MAGSPAYALLDLLQRELVNGLHDAVSQAIPALGALDPDEAFEETPFAGRVLAPLETDQPVLAALSGLAGGQADAGLRGWREDGNDGAGVGIAYVVNSGGTALAALAVVPAAGPRMVLHAAGLAAGQPLQLPLGNGFELRLSGEGADEIEVAFFPDRPPVATKLGAESRIDFAFSRAARGDTIGIAGGPSVRFGSFAVGGSVANTASDSFERRGYLSLEGGEVVLAPGFLAGLLPLDLTFPLDLELRAAPETGVVLAGSPSLRARLSGGDPGRWLDLAVDVVDAAGGSGLNVSAATSVGASLPGVPVRARVDGIGLSMPIALRLGTPMLPRTDSVHALEPEGAEVSIDLPVVSGSGSLARLGGDLAGGLSVKVPPLSASAFGVLSPAHDGQPLSFLVLVGATFPPPGVQVGFGFAVSGVGGVVGIGRRVDREALLRAVSDGSAAQLLFPADPVAAGEAAIGALPAIFPPAAGSVVAGPMLQLSWGGRVVSLSVAVLVESSTQVRLTILGKLVVALPDPEAPLVLLQATFAGIVDSAEPSATFVASLSGSHIAGAPLAGDILLLTRGGSEPTLVLSAGGFHPSFRAPRGVPALRRMSIDLCPASLDRSPL